MDLGRLWGRTVRHLRTGMSVLALLAILAEAGTIWQSLDHHGPEGSPVHEEEPVHTSEVAIVTLAAGSSIAAGWMFLGHASSKIRRFAFVVPMRRHAEVDVREGVSTLWSVRSTVIRV